MDIIAGKYAIGCTPEGNYYAYLLTHEQCCAYGESEEEALENLEDGGGISGGNKRIVSRGYGLKIFYMKNLLSDDRMKAYAVCLVMFLISSLYLFYLGYKLYQYGH